MRILGNLQLKYKFWLVNIVSFSGKCVLLASFVFINGIEKGQVSAAQGTERAIKAAIALEDIKQSVNHICNLNSQIHQMTEQQRSSTTTIQGNMTNIRSVMAETENGLNLSNQSCGNLHLLAENLSQTILHFKI